MKQAPLAAQALRRSLTLELPTRLVPSAWVHLASALHDSGMLAEAGAAIAQVTPCLVFFFLLLSGLTFFVDARTITG